MAAAVCDFPKYVIRVKFCVVVFFQIIGFSSSRQQIIDAIEVTLEDVCGSSVEHNLHFKKKEKKKSLHVCVSESIMLQQSSAASIGAVSGDSEAINVFSCCCFLSALYCQAEEKGRAHRSSCCHRQSIPTDSDTSPALT